MTKPSTNHDGRQITTLLFDFGNTLAFMDYALLAGEFSRPGLSLDAATLERAEYVGRRALDEIFMSSPKADPDEAYRVFFRKWLEEAGIPPEEVEGCGNRFRAIHQELTLWRVVRPGTFEVLEKFRSAGLKLGVVSNAFGTIESDAKRFGLAPYFDVIIDSHVVGVEKPDPRIFRIALERLNATPDQARYAGDIYSIDMVGAGAAGIEGKLIDQMSLYHWVDHAKIRGVHELHQLD